MDANGLRFWMLSQWNDWLPGWRANWAWRLGQGIMDPNGAIQVVQTAGKSGPKPPQWKTGMGNTTGDESTVWVNAGPGTWKAATAFAAGQFIVDGNGNLQRAGNIKSDGKTAATEPVWPLAFGDTVADGNLTWTSMGPLQGGLGYCDTKHRIELRDMRTASPPNEDFNLAGALVNTTPMATDQYGNYARWDAGTGRVMAGGSGAANVPPPNEVPIYVPPSPAVTDLVLGYDGILYIAVGGALVMVDRRNRWPDFTLSDPTFHFWRLAALPTGGVLALDRAKPQLAQVASQPLQTGPADVPNPGVLRPCQQNSNPPRIVAQFGLPATETFVGLAAMDPAASPAQFTLLSWSSNSNANQDAWVRVFSGVEAGVAPMKLEGVRLPYAVAWIGGQKLAVLATNLNEALVYDLENAGDALAALGDSYILHAANLGPFQHGFSLPVYYANVVGATPLSLPLLPLSLNSMASSGATLPMGPAIVDSGSAHTAWHRIFLEAVLPPRCGAIVWLAAADTLAGIADPALEWFPHVAGDADLRSIPSSLLGTAALALHGQNAIVPSAAPASVLGNVPRAVWQSVPTEVAFGPTLLGEDPIAGRQGLFMALVQRAGKKVRILSGRYLAVRLQLNGDGLTTPEIAGLRVYASRFSYVQHYLPEIYREVPGTDADKDGPSSRRDFFERFVDLYEAQLTRIEDRVANAYLLTRPESAPDDDLDWLGSWIGLSPDGYPPDRRRARLLATPFLYKWRGTPEAITRALDVATNGMASRGAIIVIEDFRLRHIFATILGADLGDRNDPLLPGFSANSNSVVGDTLFLGDPSLQAELQALYATNLNLAGGAQAAQAFYDALALRMTVFIHNQVENVNLNLVTQIVEAEKPAHVQAFVRVATQPFMIALASLVGVNTYLGPAPPPRPASVGVSTLGRYDVITHIPGLDPRMEDGESPVHSSGPLANAQGPATAATGSAIVLDASASVPTTGAQIVSYTWTLMPPQN